MACLTPRLVLARIIPGAPLRTLRSQRFQSNRAICDASVFNQFFISNLRAQIPTSALDTTYAFPQTRRSRAFDVDVDSDMYPSPLSKQPNFPLAIYPPPHIPLTAYTPIPVLTLRARFKTYTQLAKSRLTTLVVLTAMSGVALCPLSTSVPALLATAAGTALCSACANTFNQIAEVPLDAQMVRTRTRPLVRRVITPAHAAAFGIISGTLGTTILATCVNPTTAALGVFNIVLYSGAYTFMKRRSVLNTWVGAVVGAIPPLMGWAACGGHILPSSEHPITFIWPTELSDMSLDNPLAAATLFAFLFAWQFPHFNAVSHLTRAGYAQAGYRMLSVLNPRHNSLVGFRYALAMVPICSFLAPLSGLTTWWFALSSLPFNLVLAHGAWNFWRQGTEKAARKVWRQCLWYLPVMLALMMASKPSLNWLKSIRQTLGYGEEDTVAVA